MERRMTNNVNKVRPCESPQTTDRVIEALNLFKFSVKIIKIFSIGRCEQVYRFVMSRMLQIKYYL